MDRRHTDYGDYEALSVRALVGILADHQAIVRTAGRLPQSVALHEHHLRAERRPLET